MKKLLKKDNLKIEELLDEESVSDEINNDKSAIHKFLTKENLQIILNYLMIDQKVQDQKKAYKYPKVAESILSCKASSIQQFFQIEDSNKRLIYFDKLFSFIVNQQQQTIIRDEINFTRASYVKTILISLLVNQPQIFSLYLFNQELILDALISHSYSRSIFFILKTLLQVPHKEDENPNEIDQNVERESVTVWITELEKNKINLLEKILQILLTTSDNSQKIFQSNNLTELIITYIKANYGGLEKVNNLKKDYLQSIQERFFENIQDKNTCNLGNLFMQFTSNQDKEDIQKQFDFFCDILNTLENQFFYNIKQTSTIGKQHFKIPTNLVYIITLLNQILKKNIKEKRFGEQFSEQQLSYLFSLFQKYPLNNVLHDQLYTLFLQISESEDKQLFEKFFSNKNFQKLKKDLTKQQEKKMNTFQGFVIKLVSSLEQSQFAEILYKDKQHQLFMQNFYFPKIEKENKSLGGVEHDSSVPHAEFYFSIEEIEEKYRKFLDGENLTQNIQEKNCIKNINENTKDDEEEDTTEKMIPQQVQKNLMLEIKQINESDEDLHFGDQMFWKSNIDTDLDLLMKQLS